MLLVRAGAAREPVLSPGITPGMDVERCHRLSSSVAGSGALPVGFREEGAGGAIAASSREGKGCRCESRPPGGSVLVGSEAERRSAWAVKGWQRYQKQN